MDSGIKFINWNKKNSKWVIKVTIAGERKYLGSFESLEDAKEVLIENSIPIIPNTNGDKYSVNIDYFKNVDSKEKAFWLGLICADGAIVKNRKSLCFKITQKVSFLLEKMKEDMQFTGNISIVEKQVGRYSDEPFHELVIYSDGFVRNLMNTGKTRYKLDLHEIPKSIPEELVIDFIRGYFEGDGSLYFSNHNNSWCFQFSGTKGLLTDIQKYIGFGNLYKDKSIYALKGCGNIMLEKFVSMLYYDSESYGLKHLTYRGA